MNNKFNRSRFLTTNFLSTGAEKDLLMTTWDYFVPRYPSYYRYIMLNDIGRPDLLSLRIYGRDDFWWIIGKLNPEIMDWWNDPVVGQRISICDQRDIDQFFLDVKAAKRMED